MSKLSAFFIAAFISILSLTVSAQSTGTMFSNAALDGWTRRPECPSSTPEDLVSPTGQLRIGSANLSDAGVPSLYKSFVSFDISSFRGNRITSATLVLYQVGQNGQPYASGNSITVDLIDYGTSLDLGDACVNAISADIGTLSSNDTVEYKSLDVTAAISFLASQNTSTAQFRLSFRAPASANSYAVFEAGENAQGFGPRLEITAESQPNLVVTSGSFSPTSVRAGDSLALTAVVQNNGSATAPPSRLDFYAVTIPATLTGYKIGELRIDSLAPTSSVSRTLTISFPGPSTVPPGTYFVTFVADAANEVTESDEENRLSINSPLLTVLPVCTYGISPASASFTLTGGTGVVTVTAPAGCTWNANSNAPWITITSGSTGNGSGQVNYTVDLNPGTAPRTGTLTVAGQIFTVSQQGIACTYSISPESRSHQAGAEAGSVAVTAPPGCGWTAVSNDDWITITGGAAGSGNGVVSYSLLANSASVFRTGSITIAGKVFSVTQAGLQLTSNLYFAHVANGGVSFDLVLTNPSSTKVVSGRIDLLSDNGLGLAIGLNGLPAQSTVQFVIPPLGASTFSSDGKGPLLVGAARVASDNPLSGVVRFAIPGIGIAGVGDSQLLTGFVTPVRFKSGGVNTGVAVHSAGYSGRLLFTLRNKSGQVVLNGTRSESIVNGGHIARFINELFPLAIADDFEGTLTVEETGLIGNIAGVALELGPNPGQFTTLPVSPIR
ncbi:MAG TPA: CARDB domain-containing protein [Acidobacteriota bacterium]|jgi:hypothetical protein